jgi:AcrR family transcriptional regulator
LQSTVTTTTQSQRSDARRNRELVLGAARKEFARHGLDVGMDRIARTAGVGVGTVYRHFPSKEQLLVALADERFTGFAEAARESLQDPDAWNGFCRLLRHCGRVVADEDRAISEAMDQHADLCHASAEKASLTGLTAELIANAQAQGALRADFSVDDIPSLMRGLARATAPQKDGPPAISWERYLEIMLAGLRADATR